MGYAPQRADYFNLAPTPDSLVETVWNGRKQCMEYEEDEHSKHDDMKQAKAVNTAVEEWPATPDRVHVSSPHDHDVRKLSHCPASAGQVVDGNVRKLSHCPAAPGQVVDGNEKRAKLANGRRDWMHDAHLGHSQGFSSSHDSSTPRKYGVPSQSGGRFRGRGSPRRKDEC